jgi:hypothetical protein
MNETATQAGLGVPTAYDRGRVLREPSRPRGNGIRSPYGGGRSFSYVLHELKEGRRKGGA